MKIKDMTNDEKNKMLEALELTSVLECPEEEYRVEGHTECFYCNECRQYAIRKSME